MIILFPIYIIVGALSPYIFSKYTGDIDLTQHSTCEEGIAY